LSSTTTTAELRNALVLALRRLEKGEITIKQANAVARLCEGVIETQKVDLVQAGFAGGLPTAAVLSLG